MPYQPIDIVLEFGDACADARTLSDAAQILKSVPDCDEIVSQIERAALECRERARALRRGFESMRKDKFYALAEAMLRAGDDVESVCVDLTVRLTEPGRSPLAAAELAHTLVHQVKLQIARNP